MTAAGPILSAVQQAALGRYETDCEALLTARTGSKLTHATEALRRARGALSDRQYAVLELVIIRRRTIRQISEMSGHPTDLLTRLFLGALDALANHYEAETA